MNKNNTIFTIDVLLLLLLTIFLSSIIRDVTYVRLYFIFINHFW